jgi:Ca-activated chloride channel family protein
VVAPTADRGQLRAALNSLRADGGTALGDAIGLSVDAADLAAGPTGHPAAAPSSPSPGSSAPADLPAAPPASPGSAADEGGAPLVATVLLSDGKSSTGLLEPLDAAKEAAARGVPVYTIALGTASGTVEVQDNLGRTETIQVPPDTATLAAIAKATGARFFEAPTSEDLATIYEGLGSRVGFTMEQQEVTQWFAAGALLMVLAGAGLAAFWFNRIP